MTDNRRRLFVKSSIAAAAGVCTGGVGGGGGLLAAAEDRAAAGPKPPAEKRLHVNHDLHTHTLYSDGAHPIPLHVLEARAFELDAIAITDHFTPGSWIAQSDAEFERYLAEIEHERSAQKDVLVLKGAEATVLDTSGRISLDAAHAAKLEWVLCDLGGMSEGTLRKTPRDKQKYVENVVRTYLALCDVPYLDAIAHPFNTGNTEPAALPADYPERLLRELAAKMAEKRKVFDVMNDMIYWFSRSGIAPRTFTAQYVELVKIFVAEKVVFQASSDDHRTGLGNTRWSQIVLRRAAVPESQIVDPRRKVAPGR